MNEELIAKAKEAKSAAELLSLAKENNIELTEEQAKTYFAQLNPTTGELDDNKPSEVEELTDADELSEAELDNVAGGGCGGGSEKKCRRCGSPCLIITPSSPVGYSSNGFPKNKDRYRCEQCGNAWEE